jgi:hypothetical protein
MKIKWTAHIWRAGYLPMNLARLATNIKKKKPQNWVDHSFSWKHIMYIAINGDQDSLNKFCNEGGLVPS